MKNPQLTWAVLLSLAVHLCLFFALFFTWPIKERREKPVEFLTIEVFNASPTQGEDKASKNNPRTKPPKRKRLSIQDLMPRHAIIGSQRQAETIDESEGNDSSLVGRSASEVGRTMGFEVAAREYPSLAWLHRKIEGYLGYPEELILYERDGKVVIEFDLDRNGLPRKNTIKIDTNDHVLKVYVLWVLDEALAIPLPATKQLQQPLRIQLTFNFWIINPGYYPIPPQKVMNNSLNFVRTNVGNSWVEAWQRDETKGANLKLESIWDSYMKYRKKKEWRRIKFDPLEKYKRDPRY